MNVQGRITISWHVRRVPQCGDSFSLFSPGFPRFFPTFPTANDIYISKETKTPQKGKRTKRWKQKVEQKKNIKRTNWLSFCRPFSQRRLSTNTHTNLPLHTHTPHTYSRICEHFLLLNAIIWLQFRCEIIGFEIKMSPFCWVLTIWLPPGNFPGTPGCVYWHNLAVASFTFTSSMCH